MLRGLRRRLDKLWDAHQRETAIRDAARNRHGVRERFLAAIRAGLTRNGIDPSTVPSMRVYEPGNVFGPRPEPPSGPSPDSPAARLREKLLRIVECHRDEPLDLAKATPMELFAIYCFVPDAPGVTYLTG
jgi:hypothetical protein